MNRIFSYQALLNYNPPAADYKKRDNTILTKFYNNLMIITIAFIAAKLHQAFYRVYSFDIRF